MTKKIITLSGDGIGPEIMDAGLKVLAAVAEKIRFEYECEAHLFGGVAIEAMGNPLPDETLTAAKSADAILHAAIGDPKFNDKDVRPEQGLLKIRKELGLFANVRPLKIYKPLEHLSPIKNVENVDFVTVRELTGGVYFGTHALGADEASDINEYKRFEIERVARFAFDLARKRRKHVTSVDKQNVLATSKLWRKVVEEVAQDYPDIQLEHQLVDSCAMLLITQPQKFDVILTENLFGDILTDEASSLAGTLGCSASSSHGTGTAFYEPIHGSAPDIAGKGIANPMSMILSVAMMLRESFDLENGAALIESAVERTLADGILTRDLGGTTDTIEMTNAILERL